MDTSLGRIRLSEQIEEAILGAIMSGEYPAGSKLPSERVLMKMFHVGRPSVKDALLMLERKGFVELKRGIAPIVVEPTPQGAMDVIGDMVRAMLPHATRRSEFYDLRIMLEIAAVMEAARTCSDNDLDALKASHAACCNAAGKANEFRDADQAFHNCLIHTQNNSVLTALHGALIEWGLYNPEQGPEVEKIHARVITQHDAILTAICTHDPAKASDALRSHLLTRKNAQQGH